MHQNCQILTNISSSNLNNYNNIYNDIFQKLNPKLLSGFENEIHGNLNLFRYDIVSTLHDPSKQQILNLFLHKNVFGENPPDVYERYILRHDEEFEIAANTEFVLARNFNGELKRVNFKMDLESTFFHRPRLSALVFVNETPCLCTIDQIFKFISSQNIGRIFRLNTSAGQWRGKIGPRCTGKNSESYPFFLHENREFPLRGKNRNHHYDIVETFRDQRRRALNIEQAKILL